MILFFLGAMAAEVRWTRVPLGQPATDLTCLQGVAYLRMADGQIMSLDSDGPSELLPASSVGREADQLVGTGGQLWALHREPPWIASATPAGWSPRESVPVAGLTSLSASDSQLWAAGLHGTLALRGHDGAWSPIEGLQGNLFVAAHPQGAWVWSDSPPGARLGLNLLGVVQERWPSSPSWSSDPKGYAADSEGRALTGGPQLRRGESLLRDTPTPLVWPTPEALWVLTEAGPSRLLPGEDWQPVPAPTPATLLVASSATEAWLLDEEGAVWQLSEGSGVALIDHSEAWGVRAMGAGRALVADLDGDGLEDLVIGAPTRLQVWLQRDGRFVPGHSLPLPEASPLLACDLDGNGLPELVGHGPGGWFLARTLDHTLVDISHELEGLDPLANGLPGCADLNGDDAPELWIPAGGRFTGEVRGWLYRNLGVGHLRLEATTARGPFGRGWPFALLPTDLNHDAQLDWLTVNHWGQGHTLYLGAAQGLTEATQAAGLGHSYVVATHASLTQLVGDPQPDLLVVHQEGIDLFEGRGERLQRVLSPALAGWGGGRGQELDLQGDGWPELLLSDEETTTLLRGGPEGFVPDSLTLPDRAPFLQALPIDLGGDGDLDLWLTTAEGPRLWENQRLTQAAALQRPARPFGLWRRLAWAQGLDLWLTVAAASGWWLVAAMGRRLSGQLPWSLVASGAAGTLLLGLLFAEHPALHSALAIGSAGVVPLALLDLRRRRAEASRHVAGYTLLRELGTGGMGTVWLARGVDGVEVALKLIHPERLQTDADHRRYRREAELGAQVVHPGVVRILAWGEWTLLDAHRLPQPTAYIVMELLHGQTLRQRLSSGPLPVGEACAIVSEVCEALCALHALDVVHRDVKPSNIMLLPEGVKLMDLGAARRVGQLTEGTGGVLGTLGYLAPEQGHGLAPDPRADVYALGVTLYELLCGRRPFEAPDLIQLLTRVLSSPPPPLGVPVPAGLEEVLHRALAKAPEARWRSARALREALAPYTTAVPQVAPSSDPHDADPTVTR